MVLTDPQPTGPHVRNCYACKHALIAAERAMKPSSSPSTENYGALPSSYRKLRKSQSMFNPRLSRSQSQTRPLLHLKRSLSKLTLSGKGGVSRKPGAWSTRLSVDSYISHEEKKPGPLLSKNGKFVMRRDSLNNVTVWTMNRERNPRQAVGSQGEDSIKSARHASIRACLMKLLKGPTTRNRIFSTRRLNSHPSGHRDSGLEEARFGQPVLAQSPGVDDKAEQDEVLDTVTNEIPQSNSRTSLHSNARSRVTSWTNSSTTSSMALRSGPIDRNRLSVIKEDGGPHQPSSSAGRHIGGVAVFQEPLLSITREGQTLPPIDSQRVYSALMKRISQDEAEIERTTKAVQAINLEQEMRSRGPSNVKPTIRMVQSDPSLNPEPYYNIQFHQDGLSSSQQDVNLGSMADQPVELPRDLPSVRQHSLNQGLSTSFVPFNYEEKSSGMSPFRKLLRERRKGNRSSNSSPYGGSVVINQQPTGSVMSRPRFDNSTNSIYSRATDGVLNNNYVPPMDSCRFLAPSCLPIPGSAYGVIQYPVTYDPSNTTQNDSSTLTDPDEAPGRNPWLDTPSRHFSTATYASGDGELLFEDGTDMDKEPTTCATIIARGYDTGGTDVTLRRLDLNVKPQETKTDSRTPNGTLKRNGALLKRASADGMTCQDRDVSSLAHSETCDKENQPTSESSTPPLSTPGRFQLQFKNGAENGRLRKRASDFPFNPRKYSLSPPHSDPRARSITFKDLEESPVEKVKDRFVARLSRPFNMDVPPHNRPFDSMYLGKRFPGHADTLGNSRLSVAPRASKSYGGLGRPEPDGTKEMQVLAKASSSSLIGRNTSKVLGLLSSKRMVSGFLRSRRGQRSLSDNEPGTTDGSPAFI